MKYQYLLVDNDNTLMDFTEAERLALNETLEAMDIPTDVVTLGHYHRVNDALWEALERKETTLPALRVERFAQFLQAIGDDRYTAEELSYAYETTLGRHAELIPGAMELMTAVKPFMKVALVSNGVSRIQRGRLSVCPFGDWFDAVLISEEAGSAKPDPAMLESALSQMGCTDKHQAVMLGDSLSADVQAAKNAGIDSIWFSRKGKTSDVPTYTVASLAEALEILTK